MKTILKNYYKPILAILFYILIFIISPKFIFKPLISMLGRDFIQANPTETTLYYNLYVYLILFIISFAFYIKDIKNEFFMSRNDTNELAKWLVIGILLNYGGNYVVGIIDTITKHNITNNQEGLNQILNLGIRIYPIFIITVCFLGPAVEELIFRKSIGKLIKNDYLFVIVSALTFGYIHIMDYKYTFFYGFIELLNYAIPGLVFSFLYVKNKRNITIPLVVHLVNNILSTILLIIL